LQKIQIIKKKLQKIQKITKLPYPGFEPRTSGLAVCSLNHCTFGMEDAYIFTKLNIKIHKLTKITKKIKKYQKLQKTIEN
jgi:hypothetical protein